MKKEFRIIPTPQSQPIWIADDGAEFATEASCAQYERWLKFQALFDKIKMCRELDTVPPIGLSWIESENTKFYWFYVSNKADIDLLCDVCGFTYCTHIDYFYEKFEKRWVCISVTADNEFDWHFNNFADAAYVLRTLGIEWPKDPTERI